MSDKPLKEWFKISEDELHHRMELQDKYHNDPARKATAIIEKALDKVLESLGVDTKAGNIPEQQAQLGIIITEETRDSMAGLQGFFVSVVRFKTVIPVAWIGQAQLNSMGECSVEIHWFKDERLEMVGGTKLIQ